MITLVENGTRADVRFDITEGPQVIVDHVIIIGNQRTNTETIERELLLQAGAAARLLGADRDASSGSPRSGSSAASRSTSFVSAARPAATC